MGKNVEKTESRGIERKKAPDSTKTFGKTAPPRRHVFRNEVRLRDDRDGHRDSRGPRETLTPTGHSWFCSSTFPRVSCCVSRAESWLLRQLRLAGEVDAWYVAITITSGQIAQNRDGFVIRTCVRSTPLTNARPTISRTMAAFGQTLLALKIYSARDVY